MQSEYERFEYKLYEHERSKYERHGSATRWGRARTRGESQAELWAGSAEVWAGTWVRTWVTERVWTEVWVPARAWEEAEVAAPESRAQARAKGRMQALLRALAQVGWIRPPVATVQDGCAPTYAEVVADLKVKVIIDSIDPPHRRWFARNLWRYPEHWWLIQIIVPVTRLPLELLQSIFSSIINDESGPPLALMLVCKNWHTIVTGIWASLNLGTRTPRVAVTKTLERNLRFLDIVVDTEIDHGDFTSSEGAYEGIFAAIGATSQWRSLVVKTFPGQIDLPEHLVDRGFQRCPNPTMSHLRSFKIKCACEMSPLLDRLLRILGTTASAWFTTVEINSANVISFLVPVYSPIFRSVKVLSLNTSGIHNPVDLLPHLHQLETLNASHLPLPIYAHDINLPFVNTLRHLTLRAVSIQWMSGRTFDVLESCTITFPLQRHILLIFSITLPNCKHLIFQGYPLDILGGVSAQKLVHLSATAAGSFSRRGARQLVWFSSRVLGESRLAPRILHISIEATSEAWMNALTFMPHLEELVIGNARPSSLRPKVLQSLIARQAHTNNPSVISATGEWVAPLCPLLSRFGLKYHRWLRTSEHFDLIPDFLSIISSRTHSNCPLQGFRVWTRSDQERPLELVEGSQIAPTGFQRLANENGIKQNDVLDSCLRR